MPRSQQARYSFDAGVLTPRVTAQADLGRRTAYDIGQYDKALQEGINFIISPQGGLLMREGFEYKVEASVLTELNRIFQFHRGGDVSDLLVEVSITDGLVHIYLEGVQISLSQPIPHLFDLSDLPNLYFTNQEVSGIILSERQPPYYLEQSALTGEYNGFHMPFREIPTHTYFDEKSPRLQSGSTTYRITMPGGGETWVSGERFTMSYDGIPPIVVPGGGNDPYTLERLWDDTVSNNNVLSIESLLSAIRILEDVGVSAVDNSITEYDVTLNGDVTGRTMEMLPRSGQSANVPVVILTGIENAGTEPAWSYPFIKLHNLVYWKCIAPHVGAADNEPGIGVNEDLYWIEWDSPGDGTAKPPWYDYQHTGDPGWAIGQVYSPWDRGFPGVGVFHQQRLILMANPDGPTTIWGSRIADYHDFGLGVNDSDPFSFDLDTSDSPKIKWAESQRFLIIGTSAGDFRLSAEVTLGPGDIQVLKQNNARSDHTRAATLDTNVFYIEQGREKLRGTTYLRNVDSWTSVDVSLSAEHLLHTKIKRVVVNQSPEAVIYGLREDGTVVMVSYLGGKLAWTELTTVGAVKDIAGYYNESTAEDELYATITYDGIDHYIQKMNYPSRTFTPRLSQFDESLSEQGVVFMDAWVAFNDTDQDLLPQFWFKENDLVRVTVNDEWVGEFTVTAAGIQLDQQYSGQFAVGYPYNAKGVTFEASTGNPKGTALGTKRRWNRIFVRTLDSALPIIQGQLWPDRTPATLMDIAEIIRIGLQDIEIRDLGYDRGVITIEQNRPYPTHVLGLFGEYTSDNA